MLIIIEFLISSAIMVLAAYKLAEHADVIALRTGLGRLFIGTLLLAAGTSLPEFLTTINSLNLSVPDLAAGNIFGSNMLNIALIGVFDLLFWRAGILRRTAGKHVLTAGLCVLLSTLSVFFVQASLPARIGWLGIDSILLVVVYVVSVYFLHLHSIGSGPSEDEIERAGVPTMLSAVIGFTLSAVLLIMVTPWMVETAVAIAETTGIGTGFVGTTLVSLVTSMPEIVTCLVAIRLGAYDLAVGNLMGSVMFNIFSLGLTDVFYTKGLFLTDIDPIFGMVGLLSLILTSMALLSNSMNRRHLRLRHLDGILIVLVYMLGVYFVFKRGLTG